MFAEKSSDDWSKRNNSLPEMNASEERTRIHVSDLMGDGREVFLLFNGAEYRLRVTNNNKLILTK